MKNGSLPEFFFDCGGRGFFCAWGLDFTGCLGFAVRVLPAVAGGVWGMAGATVTGGAGSASVG
jgi:hypothetical protein